MSALLEIVGRYYRTVPIDEPGYVYESLKLDPRKTALIGMHCWNIGCEDGPPIDPRFWVGMGFRVAHVEAARIMRERIRPAMDWARRAGITVYHVESETIRENRQRSREPAENPQGSGEPSGWRQRIAWRSHGKDYATKSPLSRMDRARIVAPLPGERLVYRTDALHDALKERGVENLIYCGFATDMCVLRSPGGIEEMAALNYHLFLIRDATLGVECPDTFKERLATRWAIRFFETHYGDTITTDDFVDSCEKMARG